MAGRAARLDHVQLAMPAGREDDARRFWADLRLAVEWDRGLPERCRFSTADPFRNRVELVAAA